MINLFKRKHKCTKHQKPLVSMYCGFNTRNIIWECDVCGKREAIMESRSFSAHFSMPTTDLLTYKEFNEVLNCTTQKQIDYANKQNKS